MFLLKETELVMEVTVVCEVRDGEGGIWRGRRRWWCEYRVGGCVVILIAMMRVEW